MIYNSSGNRIESKISNSEINKLLQDMKGKKFSIFPYTEGGTLYYFIFVKEDNKCFMKLAGKESKGYQYINTVTFLESYELNSCICTEK